MLVSTAISFAYHFSPVTTYSSTTLLTLQQTEQKTISGFKFEKVVNDDSQVLANLFRPFFDNYVAKKFNSSIINNEDINIESSVLPGGAILKLRVSSSNEKALTHFFNMTQKKIIHKFNNNYHVNVRQINKSIIEDKQITYFSRIGFILKFSLAGILIGFLFGFLKIIIRDRDVLEE